MTADVTYLSHQLDEKSNKSAVSVAHVALKCVQSILPLDNNPLHAGICNNLVEEEKFSKLDEPIEKKEPVLVSVVLLA